MQPADDAPTTDAAWTDARGGSTSRARNARRRPQSGSLPRPVACIPWGSSGFLAEVLGVKAVVRDLGHLGPLQTSGIADRVAQPRRRVAMRDDVEPVAVAAVLGYASLVRREQHAAVRVADTLHLDQSQFTRFRIE